jgi:hypothetical protein
MNWTCARAARWHRTILPGFSSLALLGLLSVGLTGAAVRADGDSSRIVRIEEDWELVLGEPDAANVAPQVTTSISPSDDLNGYYAAFELNHQSQPDFSAGGLQLQLWSGETPLGKYKRPGSELLSTSGEVVTWTQSMSLGDDGLTFEILNGQSTTWGSFGGQGYMKAQVDGGPDDLNDYRPQVSVANSGVGFASNRVASLTLKRVRAFTADGQMVEDGTSRAVYPRD